MIALYLEVNGPERSYNDQFYVSIYICVHCTGGLKAYSQQLIYKFHRVQHCTGYPLIQVEIASYMYIYVLAGFPKFLHVDFLVPGVCGHSLTVSSVGAGAGAGSSAGASSAISMISSFLSENTESDTGSTQFCLGNKIAWYFIDKIVPDKVSFLIRNIWRMKLSFLIFCQMAVFRCWVSDVSTSDLQHTSGSSVYLGLIRAILLHNPVGV